MGLSYLFIIQLEFGVGVDGRRSSWISLELGGYTLASDGYREVYLLYLLRRRE
jgi:hypothetical protein